MNEGERVASNPAEKRKAALMRHPEVAETLAAWCGPLDAQYPLSMTQVAETLSHDKTALYAARQYLGFGGEGYESDSQQADAKREELAWAVIDVLVGD